MQMHGNNVSCSQPRQKAASCQRLASPDFADEELEEDEEELEEEDKEKSKWLHNPCRLGVPTLGKKWPKGIDLLSQDFPAFALRH